MLPESAADVDEARIAADRRAALFRVVALSGGVGGAKLVRGLALAGDADGLVVVVNTGDDFRHCGLHISPDIDTVLYTLAGVASHTTGWGLRNDTRRVMSAVAALGAEPWFHLGDRDLATHLVRTEMLDRGARLTAVTATLAARLGVAARVLPMTDDPVRTVIETADGDLAFQDWFVRRRCQPEALGVRYEGADAARPSVEAIAALAAADAVIVGPSNPCLSIGPILALGSMRDHLRVSRAPIVAVSPIVGGRALKGPTAVQLRRIAGESSVVAVARLYVDFIDGLLIDRADAPLASAVEDLGVAVRTADIVMRSPDDRMRVARATTEFARELMPPQRIAHG